jgi:cyclopropane-fatty-acyl-phospholipid synthase
MDSRKEKVMPVLERTYGKKDAARWFQRWRIFFMACAELWGFRHGQEWWVAHYLFRKR